MRKLIIMSTLIACIGLCGSTYSQTPLETIQADVEALKEQAKSAQQFQSDTLKALAQILAKQVANEIKPDKETAQKKVADAESRGFQKHLSRWPRTPKGSTLSTPLSMSILDDYFCMCGRIMGNHSPPATLLVVKHFPRSGVEVEIETTAAKADWPWKINAFRMRGCRLRVNCVGYAASGLSLLILRERRYSGHGGTHTP
jgi:hypothetical protein